MNSNLLAGLAVGSIAALAIILGAMVAFPPPPGTLIEQEATDIVTPPAEAPETSPGPLGVQEGPDLLVPEPETSIAPLPDEDPVAGAEPALPDPDIAEPDLTDEVALPDPSLPDDPDPAPEPEAPAPDTVDRAPAAAADAPFPGAALSVELAPAMPSPDAPSARPALRDEEMPRLRADGSTELPRIAPPAPLPGVTPEHARPDDPLDERAARVPESDAMAPPPSLQISRLPSITAPRDLLPDGDVAPAPQDATRPALERNAMFTGAPEGFARMAVVLLDPGLPTPMRRELAAMDVPVTFAINPRDPSASEAAALYRAAGKEVVILATGLSDAASASDLDSSFALYFDVVPRAIGVIELPERGFSRNASLLRSVIPFLAADGHALLTFREGLSQAGQAAQAAGVAHAEVFRVLDSDNESPFVIRRYLDRAVFQAAQIGQVIVFGDASNDATLEAIDMWLEEGRVDQVALVPVSGILLEGRAAP